MGKERHVHFYLEPVEKNFEPTNEQFRSIFRLYVDKGLLRTEKIESKYSEEEVRALEINSSLGAGGFATDDFIEFVKLQGWLYYLIGGPLDRWHWGSIGFGVKREDCSGLVTHLLVIGFWDPYYDADPTAEELEEFDRWELDENERNMKELERIDQDHSIGFEERQERKKEIMRRDLDTWMLDPRYNHDMADFHEQIEPVLTAKLQEMGIIDGLRQIIGCDVKHYATKEDDSGEDGMSPYLWSKSYSSHY